MVPSVAMNGGSLINVIRMPLSPPAMNPSTRSINSAGAAPTPELTIMFLSSLEAEQAGQHSAEPRDRRQHHEPQSDDDEVGPEMLEALLDGLPPRGTGDVEPDAGGRGERPDSHSDDQHHRVVHGVDPELQRDRQQQRREDQDRRQPFEQ